MKKKNFYIRCLCFTVVTLLTFIASVMNLDATKKVSLLFEDTKYTIRAEFGQQPKINPATVIIAIDEHSINELGRWPWDRHILAELLTKLSEAAVVCLDIVFSEPASPTQDEALTQVISENGNIIAGFFLRPTASADARPDQIEVLHDSAYQDVIMRDPISGVKEFPFGELNIQPIGQAALAQAFFTTEPDPDGLYRRYPVAYAYQGYYYPPLAVQILRYSLNQEAKLILDRTGVHGFSLNRSMVTGNHFALNFPDPDKTPMISAVDVIRGTIPPDHFKDKLILVGVTETGIFDLRPTPVDPIIPGVWIHFTALNNLLNNDMLQESSELDYLMTIITLLMILAASFVRRFSLRISGYFGVIGLIITVANTVHITNNFWFHEFYPVAGGILLAVCLEATAFLFTEIRAGALKKAFVSYVSPEVVGELLAHPEQLELGGGEREISILFSDIRGFTTLSEKVSPRQLVEMLTAIHNPMTGIVLNNKGMLDKYIGDAMMALFNTPVDLPDHADGAVRSALDMVASLEGINRDFAAKGLPAIDVGVGINTGLCIVGNMGSTFRFNYTAIGDAVNLASRLEGLTKAYHSRVIISEYTAIKLSQEFICRPLDRVKVKGKNEPVAIFQPLMRNKESEVLCQVATQALHLYFAGKFTEAAELFQQLATEYRDPVAPIFVDRCLLYRQNPPSTDWDGVHVLESK
ncbi:MAG: adenylate/guanylate cyclase domain-containing protein [Proteobacteria bacterium]|nr:adenylate/guanylate cyclase domain-containing protein [Pseudomonadota bacterium]MBU1686775.1 adenylate/guanylate cyclase domain-containing protein [Pseudomonadota bacterium]